MEGPTPVVFKSISRATNADVTKGSLAFVFFNLEYHQPEVGNGYYLLINHSDPSHPLKLYQSAMNKLQRQLVVAFEEAQLLEQQQPPPPDNEYYDCGIINSHGTMSVHLVISTFQGRANIWLRLYGQGEKEGQNLPTKIGVRFSRNDDIEALNNFLNKNKK